MLFVRTGRALVYGVPGQQHKVWRVVLCTESGALWLCTMRRGQHPSPPALGDDNQYFEGHARAILCMRCQAMYEQILVAWHTSVRRFHS